MSVRLSLRAIPKDLGCNVLEKLGNDIAREFKSIKLTLDVQIERKTAIGIQSSINKRRNQWNSLKILEWLNNFKPDIETRILGFFDVDAYADGFEFVFGEAFYRGRVAAVYLSRLRQEFYGMEPNTSLFYQRLIKEAVHELGHVFGFSHCLNSECVMYFSTTVLDVDTKGKSFCYSCRKKYLDSRGPTVP